MSAIFEPPVLATAPTHGARITAVCKVSQLQPDAGRVGTTAIDKRPILGPVRITRHGILGDFSVDREHHGDLDQAVYLYSDEAAAEWEAELQSPITPGQFGENLRTSGLSVDDLEVGTVLQIGSSVRLEVTKPRIPCATFGRWMNIDRWVKRFQQMGNAGAYTKVLTPGTIESDAAIVVESTPGHGVTVRRLFTDPTAATDLVDAYENNSFNPIAS